jgi:hypothetical protein
MNYKRNSFFLYLITERELNNLISPEKSSGSDDVSSSLVERTSNQLILVPMYIFNKSLLEARTSIFKTNETRQGYTNT